MLLESLGRRFMVALLVLRCFGGCGPMFVGVICKTYSTARRCSLARFWVTSSFRPMICCS